MRGGKGQRLSEDDQSQGEVIWVRDSGRHEVPSWGDQWLD